MAVIEADLEDIRTYNLLRGPRCRTGLALAAMDADLRATVEAAIADPTCERSAIVRWLRKRHGIVLSDSSFQHHAAGKCRCG
jgi:hypothetical protein